MKTFTTTQLPDRRISGIYVSVTRLDWTDGGTSFEVHRLDTDEDLTIDGCFDYNPTDEQILDLLDPSADFLTLPGWWTCPGCGRLISEGDPDMVKDHVRDCELVDGAGQPLTN